MSIGIAMFPDDGSDSVTLLRNADAALYRAKADGRGAIRFFEAEMDRMLHDRRALQADLALAVSRNELQLYYQPQAQVAGQIVGFEALLRWDHPRRGFVPPGTFIPLAEESGLIDVDRRMGAARGLPRGGVLAQAAADRDQSLARAASPWRSRLAAAFDPAGDRACARPAGDRDHRRRADRRLFARGVDPAAAQGARRAHRDGRFRHRLFVALLSAVLPVRQDQDRPDLHLQSRSQRAIRRDRARGARSRHARSRSSPSPKASRTQQQLAILRREGCDEMQGYLIGRPQPIADYAELIGRSGKDKRVAVGA